MQVSRKVKIGLIASSLVVAFAFGRYSAGSGKQVSRDVATSHGSNESAVTSSASAIAITNDHTVETREEPSGVKVVVKHDVQTQVVYRDVVHETVKTVEVERKSDQHVSASASRPQWRLGLSAGLTTSSSRVRLPVPDPIIAALPTAVGVSVERRIVGPVWAGVDVDSSKYAGLRVSVEF